MDVLKKIIKCTLDIFVVNSVVLISLLLFTDFNFTELMVYMPSYLWGIPLLSVTFELMLWGLRGYRVLWQFAGTRDRLEFEGKVILSAIPYCIIHPIIFEQHFPLSVYLMSVVFMCCGMMLLRSCYKIIFKIHTHMRNAPEDRHQIKNVMIVGAGDAGNMLEQDIINNPAMRDYRTACFVDDDKRKIGTFVRGVRVVGNCDTIPENVEKYNISLIIFAIPSCTKARRAEILNVCSSTDCKVKIINSIDKMLDDNVHVGIKDTRDIQVEDLLGRDTVKLDQENVKQFIAGKTVLVTGGGGSIGSELCRQIAAYGARRLIIFDIYENNAYDIQNELKRHYPELDLVTLIGSVRDTDRLESVFEQYRPEVVYHAAAHKHVPLMEDSPNEAVKNNVFGTLNVVRAADKFGVKRFIMISTDKAVNPTNVMGATKRICEMIIQTYARRSKTEFAAVRFGNVLGSNGSVIPLFKRQIAEGGPVTVTDKNIIRYFMTIPEAVSLVLEAGVDARGGEIFVLDMGKPVKIATLAENLIRLSGYRPNIDIKIEYTGLRPGEKMYEEMLMSEEGLTATDNKLIFIGKPIDIDETRLFELLDELHGVMADDHADIRRYIHELVPTYNEVDVSTKPETAK